MEGNFLVRFKVETYMFVFCSDNQLNSYKSEAKWVYFWDQQFDYRALSRAMGCYILFPVYHLEMVSRLLFVFKKASPLTVVFIHQGYENSYILLELWTKFQASLSKTIHQWRCPWAGPRFCTRETVVDTAFWPPTGSGQAIIEFLGDQCSVEKKKKVKHLDCMTVGNW